MGIVDEILGDKGSELQATLVENAGFSPDQAQGFLPPAVSGVADALGKGSFDISSLLTGSGIGSLISQLDIGSLASQAGIDESKATSGLQALVPQLMAVLQSKAGGAGGVLSLLGGGDAGGALGKLAGGFFKR